MSSALQNLTPEERDERVLMILRASGSDGFALADAYEEGRIRAALKTSLIPCGLAEVRGWEPEGWEEREQDDKERGSLNPSADGDSNG